MRRAQSTLSAVLLVTVAAAFAGACGRGGERDVAAARSRLDNPVWVQKTPRAAPAGVAWPAITFDYVHGYLLLFGGISNGVDSRETWKWDGAAWTRLCPSTTCTTSPPARHGAMLASDAAARMVLFGGCTGGCSNDPDFLGDTWTWNGTTWTQQSPALSPPRMAHAAMAFLPAANLAVLFGGRTFNGGTSNATWSWSGAGAWVMECNPGCGASLPKHRSHHSIVYNFASTAANQYLLMYGGDVVAGGADTWKLSWAPGLQWTQVAGAGQPGNRMDYAMGADFTGASTPVLVGGYNPTTGLLLDDGWKWDAANSVWASFGNTTPRPQPREGAVLGYQSGSGGGFMLFGGRLHAGSGTGDGTAYGDTWALSNAGTWQQKAMGARSGLAMTYDPGSKTVLMFGGDDGFAGAGGAARSDLWRWDGSLWTRELVDTAPSPRAFPAAAFQEAAQQLVVVGGYDKNSPFAGVASSWVFANGSWSNECLGAACVFPFLMGASMVYDSTRDCLVLFGGKTDTSYQNRIFERCLNAGTYGWQEVCTSGACLTSAPPVRAYHAGAYDRNRGRVVFYGGCSGTCAVSSDVLYDTREWDGTMWTIGASGPPPLFGHTMTYDSRRKRVVAVGGVTQAFTLASDWYEYDATGWKTMTAAGSPAQRFGAGLAYDARRGLTVLYGGGGQDGSGNDQTLGDTWEYVSYGGACATSADCDDGYACVTGFCCSAACGGQCQVCAAALGAPADGTCGEASANSSYPGNPACGGGLVCAGGGAGCLTSCGGDANCQNGYFCAADGSCHAVVALGAACAASHCKSPNCRECGTGTCVDGVCCGSACAGPCERCTAGTGMCDPIPDGTDPANECADGAGTCGAKVCNGNRACRFVAAEVSCTPQSCSNGTLTLPGQCDGYGACPVAVTQSCMGFACNGTSCRTSCTPNTPTGCAAGFSCNASGTACVGGKAAGETCDGDGECASGVCADRKCCGGPCDHSAPVCGGSCDSTGACSYPAAATTCSCGGTSSHCNGAGVCDCNQHDAGVPDGGAPDGGAPDGGPQDAPAADAPLGDGAASDAVGPPQDGPGPGPDGGKSGTTSFLGCRAAPTAGGSALPLLLLAPAIARRRRRR